MPCKREATEAAPEQKMQNRDTTDPMETVKKPRIEDGAQDGMQIPASCAGKHSELARL